MEKTNKYSNADRLIYKNGKNTRWNDVAVDMEGLRPILNSIDDSPISRPDDRSVWDDAKDTYNSIMRKLNLSQISWSEGDLARTSSVDNVLLSSAEQVTQDPEFKKVMEYVQKWRQIPDKDKFKGQSYLEDVLSTGMPSNDPEKKYDFSKIKASKSYSEALFEPVFETAKYDATIPGMLKSKQEFGGEAKKLPGLPDVPVELRGAYTKYSGWIAKYLERQEELGLPAIDYISSNNFNDPHIQNSLAGAKQTSDYKLISAQKSIQEDKDDFDEYNDTSEYWKRKVEEKSPIYSALDNAGSSLGEWGAMIGGLVLNQGANMLAKSMTKGAASKALGIAGTVGDVALQIYQRKSETNTEYGDAWNSKFSSEMKGFGSTPIDEQSNKELLSKLDTNGTDEYLISLLKKEMLPNGELTKAGRTILTEGYKSGSIKNTDPNVLKAIGRASVGSNAFYSQQMALGISDAAEAIGFAVTPFGMLKKYGKAGGLITDLLKSENKFARTSAKVATVLNDAYKKKFFNISPAKAVAGLGATMLAEGFEEVSQNVISNRYQNEALSNSNVVGDLINSYTGGAVGVGVMLGMDSDEKYLNKVELKDAFLSGAYGAILLGGGMGAVSKLSSIPGDMIQKKVDNYVHNTILSNLESKTLQDKAGAYIDSSLRGRSGYVREALNKSRENLPAGVTAEDIDDQLKLFDAIGKINSDKRVSSLVKKEYSTGSAEHKALVGLILSHNTAGASVASDLMELKSSIPGKLEKAIKDDKWFETNIISTNNEIREKNKKDGVDEETGVISDLDAKELYRNIHELFAANTAVDLIRKGDPELKSRVSKLSLDRLESKINYLNARLSSIPKLKNEDGSLNISEYLSSANESLFNDLVKENALADSYNYELESEYGLRGFNYEGGGNVSKKTYFQHRDFVKARVDKYLNSTKEEERIHAESDTFEEEDEADNANPKADVVETKADEPSTTTDENEQPKVTTEDANEDVATFEDDDMFDQGDNIKAPVTSGDKTTADSFEDDDMFAQDIPSEEAGSADIDPLMAELNAAKKKLIDSIDNGDVADNEEDKAEDAEESASAVNVETTSSDKTNNSELIDDINDEFTSVAFNRDWLSHTLFYKPDNNKSLFKDRLPGTELAKLMNSENPLDDCDFEVTVTPKENGRDSYVITILLKKNSGPFKGGYYAFIADPSRRQAELVQLQEKVNNGSASKEDKRKLDSLKSALPELLKFRNEIIDEFEKTKGSKAFKLIPYKQGGNGITIADGELADKNKTQRKLTGIKGLSLPRFKNGDVDVSQIGVNTVKIGISSGEVGQFDVYGADGSAIYTLSSRKESNAGGIFIMQATPKTKRLIPIKLNKKRMMDENQSTVDLIYNLAIKKDNESRVYINEKGVISDSGKIDTGLTAGQLLFFIANFSGKTIKSESDIARFPFLVNKQFGVGQDGLISVGSRKLTKDESRTADGEAFIKQYIKENVTWNVDKNHLWNETGSDRRVANLIGQSISGLLMSGKINEFKLSDSIVFTKDDLRLSWTGFLLKSGKLTANLDDKVFETPYMYLEGVKSVPVDSAVKTSSPKRTIEVPTVNVPENTQIEPVLDTQIQSDTNVQPEPLNAVKTDENSLQSDASKGNGKGLSSLVGSTAPRRRRGANMVYSPGYKNVIDIQRELEWIHEKLGKDTDVEVVDKLIELGSSRTAMGVMHADAITIWDKAASGTLYHEAYHRVSLLLLSKKERASIYALAVKENPYLEGLSNSDIEEFIAEKFRVYMLSKSPSKTNSFLNRAFRKIYNFVRKLVGLSYKDLTRLFNDIDSGLFKGSSVNIDSLREFNDVYGNDGAFRFKDIGLDTISSRREFEDIIDSLVYALFKLSDVKTISDIRQLRMSELKASIAQDILDDSIEQGKIEVLKEIYTKFDSVFQPAINESLSAIGISETEEDTSDEEGKASLRDEVGAHTKASYEYSLKEALDTDVRMFIRTQEVVSGIDEETDSFIFDKSNLIGYPRFVNFDEAWGKISNQIVECLTVEDMMSRIDQLAAGDIFFDRLYSRLQEVNDENFITKFWQSTRTMVNNFVDASYIKAGGKHIVSIRDTEINSRVSKISLAWGSFFAYNDNLYTYTEDGFNFNSKYASAIVDRYNNENGITQTFKKMMNSGVLSTTFKRKDGSSFVLDLSSREGLSIVIDEFAYLHGLVGIDIDNTTISNLISDGPRESIESIRKNLSTLISSKNGPTVIFNSVLKNAIDNKGYIIKFGKKGSKRDVAISKVFQGETYVKKLAIAHSATHETGTESMVLGPDNNMMYKISLPNYISDKIDIMNNDKNDIKKMLSSTFIKGSVDKSQIASSDENVDLLASAGITDGIPTGSLAINQIMAGEADKLELATFIKFYQESAGDKGRDYFSISTAEDYIIKLSAAKNNYLPLPTMADKKTYYFIKGLKLPNSDIRFIRQENPGAATNNVYVGFSKQHLTVMSNYFKAELLAIKDAYIQYEQGSPSTLIDVYHIGRKQSSDSKEAKLMHGVKHGNALRFRHFGDMKFDGKTTLNEYINAKVAVLGEDGFKQAISAIEERLMNDELIAVDIPNSKFGNGAEKYIQVYQTELERMINSSLNSALWSKEIPYATEIGLISFDGARISSLTNNSLPLDEFLNQEDAIDKNGNKFIGYNDQAAIANSLANNLVNGIISTIEFEKLVAKDGAFYKDSDAKIKRYSSMLSTGNALRTTWPDGHEMNTLGSESFSVSELLDNEIYSKEAENIKLLFESAEIGSLIKERKGVSIDNLYEIMKDNSSESKSELDKLRKRYPEEFIDGEIIAKSNYSGYTDPKGSINETDATVFISPIMHKKIAMMLGEWNEDMQKAFDILESDDISWLSDSTRYNDALRMVMKPLKMIYYGDKYDVENKLNIPILDKMAMFTLFKSIATGDLRRLYDRMNTTEPTMSKIDMIPFNSAVKVGNDKAISYYTDSNNDQISDLGSMKVTSQDFKYLRRQLLTDPHEHPEIAIATQPIKASMSNIVASKVYSNITFNGKLGATGAELISMWNNCLNAISDKGVKSVSKELGISYDEAGNVVVNSRKITAMLYKDAKNSGMPSDFVKKLKDYMDSEFIPLQAMADNGWVESRIISMLGKKIIDIETPGGMFIQMSVFGMKSIDAESLMKGKITQSEFEARNGSARLLNNGERLRFRNDDGSMDCVVSLNLFKDIIPKELKKASYVEKKNWLISQGIIGKESRPLAIGYRVPTQGLSSVSGLKVVDVIEEVIADTIILPSEFTKLTGSDFDIDKLFLARYTYKRQRDISRDDTREKPVFSINDSIGIDQFDDNIEDPYKNNSIGAITNRLLDVMMAAITETTTVNETRQPLDTVTDELKNVVLKDIESLTENKKNLTPFNTATPSYQSRKKSEYAGGKSGIAPFALNNAHHVLGQMTGLSFNSNIDTVLKHKIGSLSNIKGIDGKRILDWLSAMINAHVDVAKDPYIVRLGVNKMTYQMTSMLLRAGKGESTFYFLSQKALKDISFDFESRSGKYGVDDSASRNAETKAINKVKNEYIEKAKQLAGSNQDKKDLLESTFLTTAERKDGRLVLDNNHVLDKVFLRNNLTQEETFDWYFNQLMIIETYSELAPFANSLSSLVKYSQVDNKKYGKTFQELRFFNKGVDDIRFGEESKLFANSDDLFTGTFIDHKLDNITSIAKAVTDGLFFRTTESVERYIDHVANLFGKKTNLMFAKEISRAIDSYIKEKFFRDLAESRGVDIKSLFYGNDTTAKRLYRIQNAIRTSTKYSEFKNNEIINSFVAEIDTLYSTESIRKPDHVSIKTISSNTKRDVDVMKDAWMDLIESDIKEISDFGKDLILYQFFIGGDNMTIGGVKLDEGERDKIGLYDFIKKELVKFKETKDAFEDDKDKVLHDIISNKWHNDTLVKMVEPWSEKSDYMGGKTNIDFPSVKSPVKIKGGGVYRTMFILENARTTTMLDGNMIFDPYVKVACDTKINGTYQVLYKLAGTTSYMSSNGKNKVYPVYVAIDRKGFRDSGKFVYEAMSERSIISDNILPYKINGEIDIDALLNAYNAANPNFKMAEKAMASIREKMRGFIPIDSFFYNNDNESLDTDSSEIYNTVDRIAKSDISKGIFGTSNLYKEFNGNSYSDLEIELAIYMYAGAILKESNALDLEMDAETGLPVESPDNAFKMRIEAYSTPILNRFSKYNGYFVKNANQSTEIKEEAIAVDFTETILPTFDDFVSENSISDEEFNRIVSADTIKEDTSIPVNYDLEFAGVKINLKNIGINFNLNDQQDRALSEVSEWYESEDNNYFTIIGSAGSGKTSIMKIIVAALGNKVSLAAPTNNQARALTELSGKAALTIHKTLGLAPLDESDEGLMFEQFGRVKIVQDGLLVVDEASMIEDANVALILEEAAAKNTKVLFLGDDMQLDPVNNNGKQSDAFITSNFVSLSKVERQAAGNPITRIINAFRTYAKDHSLKTTAYSDVTENGAALFLPHSEFSKMLKYSIDNYYNTAEGRTNPNFVKWIAYRNDTVDTINNSIRESLGRGFFPEKGEFLTAKTDSYEFTDKKKKVYNYRNAESIIVDSVEDEGFQTLFNSRIHGKFITILNLDTNKKTKLFVPSRRWVDGGIEKNIHHELSNISRSLIFDESQLWKAKSIMSSKILILDDVFMTNQDGTAAKKNGTIVKLFPAPLKYAYTITSHASQGRQFNNVFVHESDMQMVKTVDTEENYRKMVYVAASRAVNNLFGITSLPRTFISRENGEQKPIIDTNMSLDIAPKTKLIENDILPIWDRNKELILSSRPDTTIQAIIDLANEVGINELEAYIKKCY